VVSGIILGIPSGGKNRLFFARVASAPTPLILNELSAPISEYAWQQDSKQTMKTFLLNITFILLFCYLNVPTMTPPAPACTVGDTTDPQGTFRPNLPPIDTATLILRLLS
jgi:hypothetical protein